MSPQVKTVCAPKRKILAVDQESKNFLVNTTVKHLPDLDLGNWWKFRLDLRISQSKLCWRKDLIDFVCLLVMNFVGDLKLATGPKGT